MKSRLFSRAFVPLIAAGVIMLALAGGAPRAFAQSTTANCSFLEISATNADPASIDASLKAVQKKLKRPPFTSWNTFKLLGKASKQLALLKSEVVAMTLGQASVLFRQSSQPANKKLRFELEITVDDQNGKRVLDTKISFDDGDYIVIGRSLANNDGHLLAMTCKP
jgi:hypothetical protein